MQVYEDVCLWAKAKLSDSFSHKKLMLEHPQLVIQNFEPLAASHLLHLCQVFVLRLTTNLSRLDKLNFWPMVPPNFFQMPKHSSFHSYQNFY